MTRKEDTRTSVRNQALRDWLAQHNARATCSAHFGNSYLEGYIINGRLVLVMHLGDSNGWDLFVPASDKNDITETLKEAERALGLRPAVIPDSEPGTKHPWHDPANRDCPWAMGGAFCRCQRP